MIFPTKKVVAEQFERDGALEQQHANINATYYGCSFTSHQQDFLAMAEAAMEAAASTAAEISCFFQHVDRR